MTIARILRPRYTLSRQRILNSFYRSYSSEGDAVSTGIWDALIWLRFVVAKEFGSVQSNVLNENVQSFASISWEYALQSSALWPSNLLERTLELIHIGTGTSWGATIILYSVGLRAILFPFSLMQTRSAITANNLKPQVQKMQADAQQLKAQGRVEESHQKLRQLTKFMSVKNISPIRILGLSLFPLPFFMSTFFALRNMAHLPLESFSLEHFLWLQNLTLADPYYILPAASTALLLLSMEVIMIALIYLSSISYQNTRHLITT